MGIRLLAFIIFLTLYLRIGNNLKSQTTIGENGYLLPSQKELIIKYISVFPNNTQLSVAFITINNVQYLGIEKVDNKLLYVNNRDSVFDIGSITKVFTSTLLADLVKGHVINLNDPIETILPYKLKQSVKGRITYKSLANHTSGLPEMPDNYMTKYDTTLLRDYLQNRLILSSAPGEKYQYSNLGAGLLGYLLELKTSKSYEELLQEKIFNKYKMASSTSEQRKVQDLIVKGRDSSGNIIANWQSNILQSSTGILSNVIDLSKFVLANFSNDSILSFQRQITFTSDYMDIALGWKVYKYGGNTCYWYQHDGATDGYRSTLMMDVNTKCAVIILSNVSPAHPENENIDKLCWDLLKQEYISETINKQSDLEAPFLEIALAKGWGTNKNDSIRHLPESDTSIVGVWHKDLAGRIITRTFMPDNKVQSDFYRDPEIDVWGYYQLNGNQIILKDVGGDACNTSGVYEYNIRHNKLSFTLINDSCDGRKIGLSGVWTRNR